jgi:Na+/proline symporter
MKAFLLSFILVDIPVVLVVAIVGWDHPLATAQAFYAWRQASPWTYAVSTPAALLIAWRINQRRKTGALERVAT